MMKLGDLDQVNKLSKQRNEWISAFRHAEYNVSVRLGFKPDDIPLAVYETDKSGARVIGAVKWYIGQQINAVDAMLRDLGVELEDHGLIWPDQP